MDQNLDPQLSGDAEQYNIGEDIPVNAPTGDLYVDYPPPPPASASGPAPAPFAVAPSAAAKAAAATLSGYGYPVGGGGLPQQHDGGIPVQLQQNQGQVDPPLDPAFEALAAVVAASANNGDANNNNNNSSGGGDLPVHSSAPKPRKSRARGGDDDDDDDESVHGDNDIVVPPRSPRPVRAASSRWTPEEDLQLIDLVKIHEPASLTWNEIGEKLGKRGQVCGQRWYNFLAEFNKEVTRVEPNGKIPKGMVYRDAGSSSDDDFDPEPEAGEDDGTGVPGEPKQPRNLRRWAGEDDENLKTAYEKHGWDWDKIAEDVGHGRTARACKERWTKTLKPHDPDDDVEPEEPVSDDGDYEIDSDIDAEGEDADWDEDDVKPSPAPRPRVPRAKKTGTGTKSNFTPAGMSPVFLPKEALVAKPPIPFQAGSVIRGRRTLAEDELRGKLFSPSGKQKKVHTCPAENCHAAFKRSEHLKRHYRSVHMGSKPFPCQQPDCNKDFSRKDNLQQHMAMVHSMRAIKLDEPGPNGETHRYEPILEGDPDAPKKRQPRKSGGGGGRRSNANETASASPAPAGIPVDGGQSDVAVGGNGTSVNGGGVDDSVVDPNIMQQEQDHAVPQQHDDHVLVDPALADPVVSGSGLEHHQQQSSYDDSQGYEEPAFLSQLKAIEAAEQAQADAAAAAAAQQAGGGAQKRGRDDGAGAVGANGGKRARVDDIAVGDIAVDAAGPSGDGSYERTRV